MKIRYLTGFTTPLRIQTPPSSERRALQLPSRAPRYCPHNDCAARCERRKDVNQQLNQRIHQRYAGYRRFAAAREHHQIDYAHDQIQCKPDHQRNDQPNQPANGEGSIFRFAHAFCLRTVFFLYIRKNRRRCPIPVFNGLLFNF